MHGNKMIILPPHFQVIFLRLLLWTLSHLFIYTGTLDL